MEIRDAVEEDIAEITAIYNEVLTNSTAIYSDQATTTAERVTWWKARRQSGFPVLVASIESEVLGYATFGEFRSWPGYRFTVEGTVHIHSSARGQGVGKSLLKELIRRAIEMDKHVMIAGVDSENADSLAFLERFGFERVAHLRQVGFKFDRYLDLILLQYLLRARSMEMVFSNLVFLNNDRLGIDSERLVSCEARSV